MRIKHDNDLWKDPTHRASIATDHDVAIKTRDPEVKSVRRNAESLSPKDGH